MVSIIRPFSIALNPSEQKIKPIFGFLKTIININLINLTNESKNLIGNDGGGLDIWEESNFIMLNFKPQW